MKKIKVDDLKVWNYKDMVEYWDVGEMKKGEYVLKFEIGSRGEDVCLGEVEVVDGMFEVRDEDDIRCWLKGEIEEWWNEEYDEFVCSDFEEWFDDKNVYGECVFEELSYVYVRVKV